MATSESGSYPDPHWGKLLDTSTDPDPKHTGSNNPTVQLQVEHKMYMKCIENRNIFNEKNLYGFKKIEKSVEKAQFLGYG